MALVAGSGDAGGAQAPAAAAGADPGADGGAPGEAGSAAPEGLLLSQDFLRQSLRSTRDPVGLVDELQRKHAPPLESCEPVLGFLEMLGLKRFDLYRDLCEHLKGELSKQLQHAPKAVLASLLEETLPFLSFPPLEAVPLEVLKWLPKPSDAVLGQLSTMDEAVADKLPLHVRQLVWERFPETFQAYLSKYIDRYLLDVKAIVWCEEIHPDPMYPQPHKRRQRSDELQTMVRAIGSSPKLYRFLVDEVRQRFVDSGNPRYCALRADILMALHDIHAKAVIESEPCHAFAWHLDAWVRNITAKVGTGSLDLRTAQLQKSVVEELRQLIKGIFKPELVSAFAPQAQHLGPPALDAKGRGAALWGNNSSAGGGRSRGGASEGRAQVKKTITLTSVLLEAWRKVKSLDRQRHFHAPVVELFPQLEKQYLAKVKDPMDLNTVADKIRKNKYANPEEMRADLHLIAHNSALFNGERHKITQYANQIFKRKGDNYINLAASKLETARQEQKLEEERAKAAERARLAAEAASSAGPQSAAQAEAHARQKEEEEQRRVAEEAQRRRDKRRIELAEHLADMEAQTRPARALADAAMILASGFTVNALTNVLWFLVGEEIIKKEELPRGADLAKSIMWLLQTAGAAHDLACRMHRGEAVTVTELSPCVERQVMPCFATMLLDGVDFRVAKPSTDGGGQVDPLDAGLRDWCASRWAVRGAVFHFFCDRVVRRDRSMVELLLGLIKQLGEAPLDHPGFLHSLVTSFFMSSKEVQSKSDLGGGGGSGGGGRFGGRDSKRPASGDSRMLMPPLPPELLVETIRALFLPAVLRAAPLDTPPHVTARQHVHLSRLLALDSTKKQVAPPELLAICRTAIVSLAGKGTEEDPVQVLGSAELKDVINKRYCDPAFERANRQYEKVFASFPHFRAQCGLPPIVHGSNRALPSPSPSPFITPSPSPSPFAPSPFNAQSPPTEQDGASPRKRSLEQLLDSQTGGDKRVKPEQP